jgi:hypothetical protein
VNGSWGRVDEIRVEEDAMVVKRLVTQRLPVAELDVHLRGEWIALDRGGRVCLPIAEYQRADQNALHALLIDVGGFDYRRPTAEARRLGRAHARPPAPMSIGFAGSIPNGLPAVLLGLVVGGVIALIGIAAHDDFLIPFAGLMAWLVIAFGWARERRTPRRIRISPDGIHVYGPGHRYEEVSFAELELEVVERFNLQKELRLVTLDVRIRDDDVERHEDWLSLMRTLSTAVGYDITRPRQEARRLARLAHESRQS